MTTAPFIATDGAEKPDISRRPRMLELGAVAAFAGFAIVAFSADPATGAWVARYARAIAAGSRRS